MCSPCDRRNRALRSLARRNGWSLAPFGPRLRLELAHFRLLLWPAQNRTTFRRSEGVNYEARQDRFEKYDSQIT